MSHLNCFPPRAAGVNFWFFIAVPFGDGCWYKAKCEIRNAATQDRRSNERTILLIFREIAKWRRWRHAPRLTATPAVTDSHHRFSKRWHVANVKNIAGDDQATLMVHRNFASIACTFRFYVCLRLRDCICSSAADGNGSCHWPAPSYFEEMTHCRHQKLHCRWPGNLRLFTFTRSQLTLRRRLCGWWRLLEITQTARGRRQKHRREWPGSIEIPRIWKYMSRRSSKMSRNTSFCLLRCCRHWRHCALFSSYYHSQRILPNYAVTCKQVWTTCMLLALAHAANEVCSWPLFGDLCRILEREAVSMPLHSTHIVVGKFDMLVWMWADHYSN